MWERVRCGRGVVYRRGWSVGENGMWSVWERMNTHTHTHITNFWDLTRKLVSGYNTWAATAAYYVSGSNALRLSVCVCKSICMYVKA